jgi:hypothetical protein
MPPTTEPIKRAIITVFGLCTASTAQGAGSPPTCDVAGLIESYDDDIPRGNAVVEKVVNGIF